MAAAQQADSAPTAPGPGPGILPRADANGDGFYSYPEFRRLHAGISAEDFSAMDSSGDGLLDAEELHAATRSGSLSDPDG